MVRINVTEEIIKESLERDSRHCMIAEALKASYPDARSVSVDLATIRFTDPSKGLRFTYLTPRIAQVQLVKFDQGQLPEAFSFKIRGAQVTRSGRRSVPHKKPLTEAQRKQRTEAGHKLNEQLRKTKMVVPKKDRGLVPNRVGGKTPPVQMSDNVPFSRRRAFGLRALEY